MSPWELLAIALAGGAAGFINSVAGSGSLVTFPTLLAFGVPPVTANVSNNVGLVPGAVSGAIAWRRELAGQRERLLRLIPAAVMGGATGAVLLLVLPESAFGAIVPALIGVGVLLVAFQPAITRRVLAATEDAPRDAHWLWSAVAGAAVYGGYFGAAQGIILIAVLGLGTHDSLHRNNALKNALSSTINGIAAVVFIIVADVDWAIAGLIAAGSIIGAQVAARWGRRMRPAILRAFIVVVGVVAIVSFAIG